MENGTFDAAAAFNSLYGHYPSLAEVMEFDAEMLEKLEKASQ
ncbi:hypothetical protein UFOVP111_21 [uncultured Caudovirales phage]|uniref:Uncharacterized protein n=1 Tax=uncultured Caudovirales phage TaxID=2100421 RepID=A0A6J5L932_9CAUD|nr:hypothetical protein UFOVP111_21 [uncultured Caudovirales phage]